jgi:deoxyribodipyrimidine photo-lyase
MLIRRVSKWSSLPPVTMSPSKRKHSSINFESSKKPRPVSEVIHHREIATAEAAARVDADPPLAQLLSALKEDKQGDIPRGEAVIYWMRLEDMRSLYFYSFHSAVFTDLLEVVDNRALALASRHAVTHRIPLLILFIISPQDYMAHSLSPRRIDFALRNLRILQVRVMALTFA